MSKKSSFKQTRKQKSPPPVQTKKDQGKNDRKEKQLRMERKPPRVDNSHEEQKVMPPRDQKNDMRKASMAEQHQKADKRASDKHSSNQKFLNEHNRHKNVKPEINHSNGGDKKQNS